MLSSVVGRKVVMALTGLVWYGFLIGHLAGNLLLLAGDGGVAFDEYAAFLEGAKQLVIPTEIVLVAALGLHIWSAATLTRMSSEARAALRRSMTAPMRVRSFSGRAFSFSLTNFSIPYRAESALLRTSAFSLRARRNALGSGSASQ